MFSRLISMVSDDPAPPGQSRGDALQAPASAPARSRIYAIGDVHGCDDLLADLLEAIERDARTAPTDWRLVVVFLGDYVDRGPGSRQVINRLIWNCPPRLKPVFLKGNHEDMMLRFLAGERIAPMWLMNGGVETLHSYDISLFDLAPEGEDGFDSLRGTLRAALPPEHQTFLDDLRPSHREGGYLFAHAGVRPGVPLDDQRPSDLMWIRDRFLDSEEQFGAVVVHGHSISPGPQVLRNRIAIDTGAFATGRLTCAVLEADTIRFLET